MVPKWNFLGNKQPHFEVTKVTLNTCLQPQLPNVEMNHHEKASTDKTDIKI